MIRTKPVSKEYEEGWERIYGSKSQQKRIETQQGYKNRPEINVPDVCWADPGSEVQEQGE